MKQRNNSQQQNETIEKRIIIVDDDRDFTESLHNIMDVRGYELETAYNAEDACNKIRSCDAHLALIDIRLCHTSGIDLISKFKSAKPDILCVLMTAYADIDTSIQSVKEDAYDYLQKPIESSDLLATMDRCFEKIRLKTEKIAAEKALKESEERYRAIVEDQTEFIVRCLPDGRLTFVNEAYCRYFKQPREKLVGSSLFLNIVKEDQESVKRKKESLTIGNQVATDEHRAILPNGTIVWQQWTDRAIFDNNGNLVEIQSIGRDITERRQLEKEIIKAQKLESVGILAGGIAHDFNNSLQAVLGYITLAEMPTNSNTEIHEYLREAKKAILQTKELTQQLLTFSKGGEPIKKAISVSELIVDSAKLALSGSNVMCKFGISDDIWQIEADKGQLNQVISNLVINADHAMSEGGNINIWADNIDVVEKDSLPLNEGRYVRIMIEDRGTGISEKHLQNIFDPYFTTKQKGSGLGLAATYSIVNKHDGYITVESEIDVGTTFCLYLPASVKAITNESFMIEEDGFANKHLEKEKAGRPAVSKGRILIMDDEPIIRTILSEQLRGLKYEVEAVRDGSETVHSYMNASKAGKPFDAVIMDLTVPGGVGGKEAIKKLLEIDPEAKAIVSSGYANNPIMADSKKYGFCDALTKPYGSKELDEALQNVIKK
ncbi:MAG: response regulator [Candidatus Scalindua sp.]|nr:response regulator [Candidatus Scalindua sp.]